MSSVAHYTTDLPFVRYLRDAGLPAAAPAPAPTDALATDTAPPRQVDKTRLAKWARHTVVGGGFMAGIRAASGNTPLLAIPQSTMAQAVDFFAGYQNPAAVYNFVVKDVICKQLEDITLDATYVTRIARWSSRGAACLWFTAVDGLSKTDVWAWLSRPDFEYPSDCNPHAFSPKPDPRCPVLAVGQLAEKIEPVMGAVLLAATALGVAYGIYRADAWWHKRPTPAAAPDVEAGDVHQPLLDAAEEPQEAEVEAGIGAGTAAAQAVGPQAQSASLQRTSSFRG